MPAKWRRVMAVGCSHGDLVHPGIRKQVLAFKAKFAPEVRFELGDLIDTACFRGGAAGTADEAKDPRDDHAAALRWMSEYEPTHITYGNHDWRLYALRTHPKAIVAALAGNMWDTIVAKAKSLRAKTAPYDIEHGAIELGGTAWLHGMVYNMQAVRDTAEMYGMPIVMAHLHTPQQVEGRTVKATPSFCVGAMADDERLEYGRRKRNSLTHSHGVIFGEVSDSRCKLWLARAPKNGTPIEFPPGVM